MGSRKAQLEIPANTTMLKRIINFLFISWKYSTPSFDSQISFAAQNQDVKKLLEKFNAAQGLTLGVRGTVGVFNLNG